MKLDINSAKKNNSYYIQDAQEWVKESFEFVALEHYPKVSQDPTVLVRPKLLNGRRNFSFFEELNSDTTKEMPGGAFLLSLIDTMPQLKPFIISVAEKKTILLPYQDTLNDFKEHNIFTVTVPIFLRNNFKNKNFFSFAFLHSLPGQLIQQFFKADNLKIEAIYQCGDIAIPSKDGKSLIMPSRLMSVLQEPPLFVALIGNILFSLKAVVAFEITQPYPYKFEIVSPEKSRLNSILPEKQIKHTPFGVELFENT